MASIRKSTLLIYLNNLLAYLTFRMLRFFFPVSNAKGKNILFINTGQIGDVTISSLLLENESHLPVDKTYFLLVRENYLSVFDDYNGVFKILPINEEKYKSNLKYKLKLIKKLRGLSLEKCYNLTSARGVRNDEIALLTGASEVYCFANSWVNLKKLNSKKMDSFYTSVLFSDTQNEYHRHVKLLAEHFGVNENVIEIKNKNVFKTTNPKDEVYLTLAPFSTEPSRCWNIDNFLSLCEKINNRCKVLVLGSADQYSICEDVLSNSENVVNLCGKNNIPEAATLISGAVLHIGNDSGLTHVALKLGIPTIGIIGGYYFGKFFPFEYRYLKGKYLFKNMDCFGCEWNCVHKEPYCFTDVTVDEVYSNVIEVLNKNAHSNS